MKNIFNILLLTLLFTVTAFADVPIITCSQNTCYLVNNNDGNLVLGTQNDDDVKICTNQGSGDPECMTLDDSVPALVPDIDDNIDLGTASLQFQDAYFDGTVYLDALDAPFSVVAGANTACSTTCTGLCVFGVNTAATEADIVNCADATADECLCVQ